MGEAVKDLAAEASKKDVPSLIDNKGLGKTNVFDNSEDHFREWASDQEQQIDPADWQEEFGSDTEKPIENI